jgi:hypothetical protein
MPVLYGEDDPESDGEESKPHLVLTSNADSEFEADEELRASEWPDSVG